MMSAKSLRIFDINSLDAALRSYRGRPHLETALSRDDLENTAEGQILFVRKPEPDAAPADLEVNFKPVAIPVVDQSVAPLGHLVNFAGAHECQTF